MKTNLIIYNLDNDISLLNLKFHNHLVWPLIRYQVLQTIIDNENNLNTPQEHSKKSLTEKIRILLSIIFYRLNNNQKYEYVFFTSPFSNFLTNEHKYRNRISDYFSELIFKDDNILVVDETNFDKFFFNRVYKYKFVSKQIIKNKISLYSKYKTSNKEMINEINKKIIDILNMQNIFLSDSSKNKISFTIFNTLNTTLSTEKFYNSFFKKKNCKIIFHEDGHYSSDKAIINYCAHKNNIKIIELQHGFVSENHPSYSYAEKLKSNQIFKQYYPDFFLTYGTYWSNQVKIPGQVLKIGNPHLSNKSFQKNIKQDIILVIGSGVSVNETVSLLKRLTEIKENFIVKYRPHPQELKTYNERYYEAYKLGVEFDNYELYYSLSISKIIISELSTVLFESICFCDYINLFNTSYTKTYITKDITDFKLINTENLNSLEDIKNKLIKENVINKYWEQNWENNFLQFIQKINNYEK